MPYSHFTSEERDMLQIQMYLGYRITQIAKDLGKHISSIYRELSRNSPAGIYIGHRAQKATERRRRESRPRAKRGNRILMNEVEQRISLDHSPEQIAGRLRLEYPEDPLMHVSHETIYQHIYERIQLGSDLREHLRHGRRKRRKRLSRRDNRGLIPNRRFIEERPATVDKKTRWGDWEGDTIEGSGKKGYVGTFVDRRTKFLIAFPMRHKSASLLVSKARGAFSNIPATHKKTITVDNGKEFASHIKLASTVGVKVYFAHPYHSWERGLNEHTNGLMRQYLPKTLPLDQLNHNHLASIVNKINDRPRKVLDYRTPREAFYNLPFALRT